MFESGMKILAEMAKSNTDTSVEDLTSKMAGIKFSDILKDMQSVTANEIKMTKEAVVVRGCSKLQGYNYLVEFAQLAAYMQDNRVRNFKEAVKDIAEANELDAAKFAVVVSEQEIFSMIEDAKFAAQYPNDKYARAKLEAIADLQKGWEVMSEQGVNLVKLI